MNQHVIDAIYAYRRSILIRCSKGEIKFHMYQAMDDMATHKIIYEEYIQAMAKGE